MKRWGIRRGKLPTLNYLIALEAASRLGSFKAAAEEMNLTQGAVAQQIRALEKELGIPLFTRVPRGLINTPTSSEYSDRIRLALGIIEEATKEVVDEHTYKEVNQLTLSATPAFASRWLIPRLLCMAQAYPDVAIMIDASDAVRPLTGTGCVDIAIRWGTPPFNDGQARFLASGQAIAVCSPSLLDSRPLVRPEQIIDLPLISDVHDNWKRWLKVYGVPVSTLSGPIFSQTLLALEAAEMGLGVALVPALLARPGLLTGTLIHTFSEHYPLDTEAGFYALTATTREDDTLAKKIIDWLYGQIALNS